jgi:putative DNA methylase
MSISLHKFDQDIASASTALDQQFPCVEVSKIAEQESWRKEINRPLYHIHKWWATRLGSVFRAITLGALIPSDMKIWETFYKRHKLAGKIVLDPFMGSGTTLGEALKLGAKAIGCDINPISTFLVRQALTPIAESDLRKAFSNLESEIAPQIKHYYQTRDPLSGKQIPVLYFFWVKTVKTPCGETVPLFSRYVFAQDAYPKKKPRAQIICPNCWQIIEDRYDATSIMCVGCSHKFNPQVGPAAGQYVTTKKSMRYKIKELVPDNAPPTHQLYAILALRSNGDKIYLPVTSEDISLYEEAEARLQIEDIPLPMTDVRTGHNTDQARSYNYLHWKDFFNSRQLLCLGLLLKATLKIDDVKVQEQLICLFSSTLEFNNLFCSYKGEGTGAVRHMFSNHILKPERTPLENSVWGTNKSSGTFLTLFESRLIRAKRYLNEPFDISFEHDLLGSATSSTKVVVSDPITAPILSTWDELITAEQGVLVLNGDSAHLPLPDCSVDAVITDPPYFDFVHYSELSDFFFAWLSPVLKERYTWLNKSDSSDQGEVQHKDPATFSRQLSKVFSECNRVLKDNAVLAFSFHHSRAEGWAAIYRAVQDAGLAFVAAHPVHAELRGASPKSAAKEPISLDAILVCRKNIKRQNKTFNEMAVLAQTTSLVSKLKSSGLSISKSDEFVICASQVLVGSSSENMSFVDIEKRIERIQQKLAEDANDALTIAS